MVGHHARVPRAFNRRSEVGELSMTLKKRPLTAGLLFGAAGLALMTAFPTTDPFVLQAQLGVGGVAVLIGFYLVLVVAWRRAPENLQNPPRVWRLIRGETRGRVLGTL